MQYIVMFFLLLSPLFAADLNVTIVQGDAKVYQNLLTAVTKNHKNDNESNLQKTLLVKLLDISQQKPLTTEKNITLAVTQEEYLSLFNAYISTLLESAKMKADLAMNNAKIETLAIQIKKEQQPLLTTQLFYTFYTKKAQYEQQQLFVYKKQLLKIQDALVHSCSNIDFSLKNVVLQETILDKKILLLTKKLEQLEIKKERYVLLEQENSLAWITKQIKSVQTKQSQYYRKKLALLFIHFSIAIQTHSQDIMQEHKHIITFIQEHIENGNLIAHNVEMLLIVMEQEILGKVETLKAQGLQELKIEVDRLWKIVQQPLFSVNKTPISSLKLLLSSFIFLLGFFIGNIYRRYIKNLADKNKNINSGTHTLLANMGYYAIFLITFFIVLKVLGIDLSSIALVAGALSVGIGFGLQNVISNFVSGIILMVERSVKIGDYIELDNDLRGHVVDIKMRSITVNTNANIDIIVPNQDLIQNRVVNWTMNDKIRRFEIPFGVAYGTPPQKVISAVLEAVQKSNFQDLYNTSERYTRVIMTGMGDSSVNFELFVWVKGKEILFPKRTTSRFLVLIYETLYEHNIEIPFPQQDIHIRSLDIPLKVELQKGEES